MSILVRQYLGRSRYLEELLEDWQIRYHKAQVAWDAQDLIGECIQLGQLAQRTWDFLADRLYDDKTQFDHEKAGEAMTIALRKTMYAFEKLDGVTKELDRLDCCAVDNLSEFKLGMKQVQQISKEFEEQWPSLDVDLVKESLDAYNRGDCQTSGSLLA
jgi:hypothetical protein